MERRVHQAAIPFECHRKCAAAENPGDQRQSLLRNHAIDTKSLDPGKIAIFIWETLPLCVPDIEERSFVTHVPVMGCCIIPKQTSKILSGGFPALSIAIDRLFARHRFAKKGKK